MIKPVVSSRFSIGTTILEENFKIPALPILDKNGFYDNDSIVVIKRITTKKRCFSRNHFHCQKEGDLYGRYLK